MKFDKDELLKYIKIALAITITITIIIGVITAIPNSKVETDNDWIGFFAAIIGGFISGGLTLIGVIVTIESGKDSLKAQLEDANRPIVGIYNDKSNRREYDLAYHCRSNSSKPGFDQLKLIRIENLGNGALLDFELIPSVEDSIVMNERESVLKTKPLHLAKGSTLNLKFESNSSGEDVYEFTLSYRDIFNNLKRQLYRLSFNLGTIEEIK